MKTLKVVRAAILGGAMSLAPYAVARAGIVEQATDACTTGSLVVCLSFTLINTSGNAYSLNLTFDALNGSPPGAGTGFSVFGLVGTANGGFTVGDAGAPGWALNSGCEDLNPMTPLICDNKNGAKAHDITFTFTYGGPSSDLTNLDVIAHIQGIPNGNGGTCSVKTITDAQSGESGSTAFYTDPAATDACGSPTTTSPEPASIYLLGSGLLGLGGFGAVRRRQRRS